MDYLEKNWRKLLRDDVKDDNKYQQTILALGVGEDLLHVTRFFTNHGYCNVRGWNAEHQDLKKTPLPLPDHVADVIVVRSILPGSMIVRAHMVKEIKRLAKAGCMLMIEFIADPKDAKNLAPQADVILKFDWTVVDNQRGKCVLQS